MNNFKKWVEEHIEYVILISLVLLLYSITFIIFLRSKYINDKQKEKIIKELYYEQLNKKLDSLEYKIKKQDTILLANLKNKRFKILHWKFIKHFEGGLSNNPFDKGGLTNKGITYNTYVAIIKSDSGFYDIKDITHYKIYNEFYNDIRPNNIKSILFKFILCDWNWSSGKSISICNFVYCVNKTFNTKFSCFNSNNQYYLNDDLLNYINNLSVKDEIILYTYINKYRRWLLSNNIHFTKGWHNRLYNFEIFCNYYLLNGNYNCL